jgi:hypothetical protein
MKKKHLLTLDDEFVKYCEINQIDNVEALAKKIFLRGFTIEKYGETPTTAKGVDRIVEKEVIKEILVEKIVEIIKEIPVEVKSKPKIITKEVIKEVPIEKVMWDEKKEAEMEILKTENNNLKKELEKITEVLEKMNKAKYLKSSDLNNLYGE